MSKKLNNMPKWLLVILSLIVVILTSLITYTLNSDKQLKKSEIDVAVNQAKYLYQMKIERNGDLSNGPCLSNALMPDWVADIVHSPRQEMDDSPENQCPAYLEGRARHFVELDLNGNLIRAR